MKAQNLTLVGCCWLSPAFICILALCPLTAFSISESKVGFHTALSCPPCLPNLSQGCDSASNFPCLPGPSRTLLFFFFFLGLADHFTAHFRLVGRFIIRLRLHILDKLCSNLLCGQIYQHALHQGWYDVNSPWFICKERLCHYAIPLLPFIINK